MARAEVGGIGFCPSKMPQDQRFLPERISSISRGKGLLERKSGSIAIHKLSQSSKNSQQEYNELHIDDSIALFRRAKSEMLEPHPNTKILRQDELRAHDYANAAEKLALSLKVPPDKIKRAKEEAKNVNSTAVAGGSNQGNDRKDGKGDGRGEGTSQTATEGFLEGERKKFLKRHIFSKERLRLVRSQKTKGHSGKGDGETWVHKRRSRKGDRSVRGLEIQATYTPTATLEKILDLSEISHPTVHELAKSPENAKAFREAITEAKNSDLQFGAAVFRSTQFLPAPQRGLSSSSTSSSVTMSTQVPLLSRSTSAGNPSCITGGTAFTTGPEVGE